MQFHAMSCSFRTECTEAKVIQRSKARKARPLETLGQQLRSTNSHVENGTAHPKEESIAGSRALGGAS